MRPRAFLLAGCLALALGFAGINSAARALLSGVRFDATHDRLFTLSEATVSTLKGLKEPVALDFYFSLGAAAADPAARAYGERVRDLLRTYAKISGGRVSLREHDPAPFSQAEDDALAAGVQAVPVDGRQETPLYFGLLVTAATGDSETIAFFEPGRESALEYEITRAIAAAVNPERAHVAVISSLPWLFAPPAAGLPDMPGLAALVEAQPVARVARAMAGRFDVSVLPAGFSALPPDTDVVMVAQPEPLSDWQQHVLDQFALRRGRVLVFLDPASSTAQDGGGGRARGADALGRLPSAWGFQVQPDVILDRAGALPVRAQVDGREIVAPQPLFFSIPPSGLNATSILTASLARGLNTGTPGEVTPRPLPGLTHEPLMTTSADTMRMDPSRALASPDPASVLAGWQSDGARRTLALRITGRLSTAFPSGPPQPPTGVLAPASASALAQGNGEANIIVVGDTDLLSDGFYDSGEGDAADNAVFVLNALDVMAGADGLVGLRSRAPSARPLRVIAAMRAAAQSRLVEEETRLQARLEDAASRLADLEARAGGGFAANGGLNASEAAEAARFRAEVVDTRKRLRAVQDSFRRDVEAVKALMIGVTGMIVPALAVLAGLLIARPRRARRTQVAP